MKWNERMRTRVFRLQIVGREPELKEERRIEICNEFYFTRFKVYHNKLPSIVKVEKLTHRNLMIAHEQVSFTLILFLSKGEKKMFSIG